MINFEKLLELRCRIGNLDLANKQVKHKEKMFSDYKLDESLNKYPAKKKKQKKNELRKVKITLEEVSDGKL